jgi:hypothetical protein
MHLRLLRGGRRDGGPAALTGRRRQAGIGGGVAVGAAATGTRRRAPGRAVGRPANQRVLTGGQQAVAAAVRAAGPRGGQRAVEVRCVSRGAGHLHVGARLAHLLVDRRRGAAFVRASAPSGHLRLSSLTA